MSKLFVVIELKVKFETGVYLGGINLQNLFKLLPNDDDLCVELVKKINHCKIWYRFSPCLTIFVVIPIDHHINFDNYVNDH